MSNRLVLKSLHYVDMMKMVSMLQDEKIKKTYMIPDFKNNEDAINFFNKLKSLSESNDRFVYGIYFRNELIGFLNEVQKDEKSIELGYFIASNHWNEGYMTEALEAAIKELFFMGYKRVYAGHFEENKASGRVMEKCGMRVNGEEEMIDYHNKKHRVIYYEITL